MLRTSARVATAAAILTGLLLGGCYTTNATIKADGMSEEELATYLILTDQLQRVCNVLQKPAKVCLGTVPNGTSGGLSLVPPHIASRLRDDQAGIEPRLELSDSIECLAYYVQDKAGFTPSRPTFLSMPVNCRGMRPTVLAATISAASMIGAIQSLRRIRRRG